MCVYICIYHRRAPTITSQSASGGARASAPPEQAEQAAKEEDEEEEEEDESVLMERLLVGKTQREKDFVNTYRDERANGRTDMERTQKRIF